MALLTQDMSLSKLQELVKGRPGMLQSMESQRVRHDWVAEQQQRRLGLSQVLGVGDHMFLASSKYRSRMLLIFLLHTG